MSKITNDFKGLDAHWAIISYQLSQRGRSVQNSPVGSGRNVGP